MRIGVVSRRWWPAVGGIESYSRHVTRALAERHDVVVVAERVDSGPVSRLEASFVTPPPAFEAFRDGPVPVHPLRVPRTRRALLSPLVVNATPGLRRYAWGRNRVLTGALFGHVVGPLLAERLHGIDVLHVWGGDYPAAAALEAARALDVPIVLTPFAHEGQWGTDPLAARLYASADRVLALLETEAALYRRLGVPAGRIDVVGVCSTGVASGRGGELRRRLAIDGPLVLFLGRRAAYKGFELVREAATVVGSRLEGVTFAFAGPGPPAGEARGVRVVDAGEVADDERAGWLEAADVLCLPSDGEIFPSSFLEAWSVGTPVVTSDIPPLVELVGRSGGGVNVERSAGTLADALVELLGAPERLRALGTAGRGFWEAGFTVDAVTRAHERLYRQLVETRVESRQAA